MKFLLSCEHSCNGVPSNLRFRNVLKLQKLQYFSVMHGIREKALLICLSCFYVLLHFGNLFFLAECVTLLMLFVRALLLRMLPTKLKYKSLHVRDFFKEDVSRACWSGKGNCEVLTDL